jgi:hypothetical protein
VPRRPFRFQEPGNVVEGPPGLFAEITDMDALPVFVPEISRMTKPLRSILIPREKELGRA